MHTEAEAKKKWCPEARIIAVNNSGDHVQVAGNGRAEKGGGIHRTTMCIASDCMHWRWAQKPNPDWKPGGAIGIYPAPDRRFDTPPYIEDRTKGYCGLSGRP